MGVAIQRLPVAKVLGASIVCWGAVVTGNAGAQTYRDLVALRVLLGICESSVAPALILISVMWYITRPLRPPFQRLIVAGILGHSSRPGLGYGSSALAPV